MQTLVTAGRRCRLLSLINFFNLVILLMSLFKVQTTQKKLFYDSDSWPSFYDCLTQTKCSINIASLIVEYSVKQLSRKCFHQQGSNCYLRSKFFKYRMPELSQKIWKLNSLQCVKSWHQHKQPTILLNYYLFATITSTKKLQWNFSMKSLLYLWNHYKTVKSNYYKTTLSELK